MLRVELQNLVIYTLTMLKIKKKGKLELEFGKKAIIALKTLKKIVNKNKKNRRKNKK